MDEDKRILLGKMLWSGFRYATGGSSNRRVPIWNEFNPDSLSGQLYIEVAQKFYASIIESEFDSRPPKDIRIVTEVRPTPHTPTIFQ